jgi:hypothetical protein
MLLLLAARVGVHAEGEIDAPYVTKIMGDDWGFYHTATTNLGKVKAAVDGVPALGDAEKAIILGNAEELLLALEREPKSGKWKRRADVGTKKPWYNEVSDWE